MSCMMLHNLCISVNDPCEPQWCLEVKELGLVKKDFIRTENKREARLNRLKFLTGYGICKYINIQNVPTRNIFQRKIVTCKHLLFDKT